MTLFQDHQAAEIAHMSDNETENSRLVPYTRRELYGALKRAFQVVRGEAFKEGYAAAVRDISWRDES